MPPNPTTEEWNDRLAREHPIDDYYARSPLPIRWIEGKRLELIASMARARPGERVLEVGSGGGHVLRMFRQCQLTACDVSDVFLDTARKNLQGYDVRFVKGELAEVGFESASFDCVICTEVLEHTRDPEAVLAEIARLLKPTGRAVITVPNDPLINGAKALLRRTPVGWALGDRVQWGGDEFHLHQWRPAQFRALLERQLHVVQQRSAPFDWLPVRVCFECHPRSS